LGEARAVAGLDLTDLLFPSSSSCRHHTELAKTDSKRLTPRPCSCYGRRCSTARFWGGKIDGTSIELLGPVVTAPRISVRRRLQPPSECVYGAALRDAADDQAPAGRICTRAHRLLDRDDASRAAQGPSARHARSAGQTLAAWTDASSWRQSHLGVEQGRDPEGPLVDVPAIADGDAMGVRRKLADGGRSGGRGSRAWSTLGVGAMGTCRLAVGRVLSINKNLDQPARRLHRRMRLRVLAMSLDERFCAACVVAKPGRLRSHPWSRSSDRAMGASSAR